MLIREVTQQPHTYTATVRFNTQGSKITVRTVLYADSITQARALAIHLFGTQNLIAIG
jgi:hypothetical protein